MKTRGLTLLELLVIVVVGAVVAALVLPHLRSHGVRENAYKANCISNLRQIGLGIEMYNSAEYYGVMPTSFDGTADSATDSAEAMGRIYSAGEGLVSDWRAFQCPVEENVHKPSGNDQPAGNPGAGGSTINTVSETSYLISQPLGLSDRGNKIIAGEKSAVHNDPSAKPGQGSAFHEDGQTVLFRDISVVFIKTTTPDTDADAGSIYINEGAEDVVETYIP